MRVRFLFIFISFIFFTACGDNLFYYAADKTSNTVTQVASDIAYIQNNCSYVKAQYDKRYEAGEVFDENARYMYATSIFACSGYNVVDNLASLLTPAATDGVGDNSSITMLFKLVGVGKEITLESVNALRLQYSLAMAQCTAMKTNNFKVLCGLIASADTVMSIGSTALNTSGIISLSTSQTIMAQQIRTKLGTGNPTALALSYLGALNFSDTTFFPNLTRNYYLTAEALTIMKSMITGSNRYIVNLEAINDSMIIGDVVTPNSFGTMIATVIGW